MLTKQIHSNDHAGGEHGGGERGDAGDAARVRELKVSLLPPPRPRPRPSISIRGGTLTLARSRGEAVVDVRGRVALAEGCPLINYYYSVIIVIVIMSMANGLTQESEEAEEAVLF